MSEIRSKNEIIKMREDMNKKRKELGYPYYYGVIDALTWTLKYIDELE